MMNYREQVVSDTKHIEQITSRSEHSNQLSSALSQLSIQPADRGTIAGGFLSRITSSIFSSYESGVRCSFVASCKLEIQREESDLMIGIKAGGNCCLLRTQISASPPTAVELKSVELPVSGEGYAVSSIFLGRSQGSLVAVSTGEGRISLLTVKGDTMTQTKNFQLPLLVPITSILLNERNGLVELYAVIEKKQVVVVPDITKPGEYSFVFTRSLREQIKLSEFSSISESAIDLAWQHRHKGKTVNEKEPVSSSLLLMSEFNNFKSFSEYRAVFLYEKVLELFRIENPSTLVPAITKTECLHRLRQSGEGESLSRQILEESKRMEKILGIEEKSKEIDSIFFSHFSNKLVLLFKDSTVSEIVPIDSLMEKFLSTFLSAPFVFAYINQRLSRESVLSFFPAVSKEWINVFACASTYESITSCIGDVISAIACAKTVEYLGLAKEKFSQIPPEVREHIENSLKNLRTISSEKRVEMIAALITKELLVEKDKSQIEMLAKLCKCYVVYAVYSGVEVRQDILDVLKKLSIMTQIAGSIDRVFLSGPLSSVLNRMEQLWLNSSDLEASYLSTTSEVEVHAGFRKFQIARILAISSSDEKDKDQALSLFEEAETEISLFAEKFHLPKIFENLSSTLKYTLFVASLFQNDYSREVPLLLRVADNSRGPVRDAIRETILQKAISHGDWNRVKLELASLPAGSVMKENAVRLICTEARIRNEIYAVFQILRDNRDIISTIISEIELEISMSTSNLKNLYLQIFSLSVFVKDFDNALRAMHRWYSSLLCPFTSLDRIHSAPAQQETVFVYEDVKGRLDQQIQALVLASSVRLHQHEEKKKLVFAESLAAFYDFCPENPQFFLSPAEEGGISVHALCRNLAAFGLVMQAFRLAEAHSLVVKIFPAVVAPYLELLVKCEQDPSGYLPPCRWDSCSVENPPPLMPHVVPSMAFVRSDASGPIGGSQIACMRRALEFVLKKINSKHVTVAAIEYLVLTKRVKKLYAFLEDLAEGQGAWTDLLRIQMRMENWKECVCLVETHVKHWRPHPSITGNEKRNVDMQMMMILDVPLLVQLQRALKTAALEAVDEEMNRLDRSLGETLEFLKTTLHQVSQRIII